MCSYLTVPADITGSAKGPDGWFSVTSASVYFDHPFHAPLEHSLNIDFVDPARGPGARVAVELSADSARELVRCIEAALDAAGAAAALAARPDPGTSQVGCLRTVFDKRDDFAHPRRDVVGVGPDDPMSRIRLAPPHRRRPVLQAIEKGRGDVAVSHGNDDLHRRFGVPGCGMAESLTDIGAIELQSVCDVKRPRRPSRRLAGALSPPTQGIGQATVGSHAAGDEFREQREMKGRDVPRMGGLAHRDAQVVEVPGTVPARPQGGMIERRARNGSEARDSPGEARHR